MLSTFSSVLLPDYSKHQPILLDALQKIQNEVESIAADKTYDTTASSMEVTSTKQTLGSSFPMARDRDASRPSATEVNGNSAYRVVRIIKNFTALGVQQAAQPLQACIFSQNLERPQKIPVGKDEDILRFKDSALDRPILRKYTMTGGVSMDPLPKSAFTSIFKSTLTNAGYFYSLSIHAIRRQSGKAVNSECPYAL